MLLLRGKHIRGMLVRQLSDAELAPEAIGELRPVAASHHLRPPAALLVRPPELNCLSAAIMLPGTVPNEEALGYRSPCSDLLALLLQIEPIHP